MATDAATMKGMFNLPEKTPPELLETHIGMALAKLQAETGMAAAPTGKEALWDEAVLYAAVASVLPWLHTFYLSGVAPAIRLVEGGVELRFLTPDEQKALQFQARYEYGQRKFQILGVSPMTATLPFSLGAV